MPHGLDPATGSIRSRRPRPEGSDGLNVQVGQNVPECSRMCVGLDHQCHGGINRAGRDRLSIRDQLLAHHAIVCAVQIRWGDEVQNSAGRVLSQSSSVERASSKEFDEKLNKTKENERV